VEDKTALTAVASLQNWINHWGRPVMVHCDNGSHFTGSGFTEFLSRTNIAFDPGTAYHPEGRGLVERLVGKLKGGLQRLLPQGKLLLWPTILSELELLVNQAPHKALGGISPYDYLLRGHRHREDKFIVVRDDQHPPRQGLPQLGPLPAR
jgi:transposase InsO family protein